MTKAAGFHLFPTRASTSLTWGTALLTRLFRLRPRRPHEIDPEEWSPHLLRDIGLDVGPTRDARSRRLMDWPLR